MPVAVALAIRAIIQFAITLGVTELASKFILPTVNSAIKAIMEFFGVSEEMATDIMANEFLKFCEEVGIGAATMRAKVPIAIANRLGFTSKGWAIRKTGEAVIKPAVKTAQEIAYMSPAEALIYKQTQAKLAVTAGTIAPVVKATVKTEGVVLTDAMRTQILKEQSGAMVPISTYEQRVAFFEENSAKFLKQLEVDEAVAGGKIAATTEKRLLDLLKTIAGVPIIVSGTALWALYAGFNTITAKKGLVIVAKNDNPADIEIHKSEPATDISTSSGSAGGTTTTGATITAQVSSSNVKVFTGIISAGTLGNQASFIPRPDDLITSVSELVDAAQNNLASWLVGLLGRIIYEIKIVPSVTTKEGITIHGTSSQIVSSYTTSGKPRYKTVVNRFAVMNMYILNDKGTRQKLAQITLGPTDATAFRPTTTEIAQATSNVTNNVTTTSLSDIKTISVSAPVSVATASPAPSTSTPTTTPTPAPIQTPTPAPTPTLYGGVTPTPAPAPAPAKPAFCLTSTLYDFYQAKGLDLPGISSRAQVYEGLGLGQASMYTGTAEQNTRLLAAQKIRYGCG